MEFETEDVDADGNLVVDDLVVAVDGDGKIVATDETIAVVTPEGDTVIDEKLSIWETTASSGPSKRTSLLRTSTSRAPKLSAVDVCQNGTGSKKRGSGSLSVTGFVLSFIGRCPQLRELSLWSCDLSLIG